MKRGKDRFNYSGTYSFVTTEDVQRSEIFKSGRNGLAYRKGMELCAFPSVSFSGDEVLFRG